VGNKFFSTSVRKDVQNRGLERKLPEKTEPKASSLLGAGPEMEAKPPLGGPTWSGRGT
jgi:hypothetical protein